MLKELLSQLYHKLENEKDNDQNQKQDVLIILLKEYLKKDMGSQIILVQKLLKGTLRNMLKGERIMPVNLAPN